MLGQVVRFGIAPTLAVFAAATLLLAAPAGAQVYKWTDENGNVVFSEKPPPGKEAETVTPRVSRPGSPSVASGSAPAGGGEAEAKSGQETELTPEQKARKKQNCENAKSQLADMQSDRANRLQYVTETGERAFITPEQRDERMNKAREAIQKFCS